MSGWRVFTGGVTGREKADAIRARKASGQRISALTAYDYPLAKFLDEVGIDVLLVGDSLGMVVLGMEDTTEVTMAQMIHHTQAVSRAKPKGLVLADLPIGSYADPAAAVRHGGELVAAGADAVKLEGGVRQADKVRALVDAGIPVCGHLGMLPQRVREEGGYRKKGGTREQSDALCEGAEALVDAGVFTLVLESVVAETAAKLTREVAVPTIGIGCGEETCDGEVAVVTDLIGSFPWFVPPFARPEADVAGVIREAVKRYHERVRG